MKDKLQLIFPINDWEYIIEASLSGDDIACVFIHKCCDPDCDLVCCEMCPHQDNELCNEILNNYENAVFDVIRYAKERLIDKPIG